MSGDVGLQLQSVSSIIEDSLETPNTTRTYTTANIRGPIHCYVLILKISTQQLLSRTFPLVNIVVSGLNSAQCR